ncbi:hypothetical protein [Aquimarina litoralis]|uniref:hypothetical protein n=1 Tax=Aquimarina litoralis TaxID=584605 RepID=UPI001C5671E0|nr:hypothetical protein [Aquimarina litoralis]MBW1294018.1 hypothetical protein [Aquimarina litoralis]
MIKNYSTFFFLSFFTLIISCSEVEPLDEISELENLTNEQEEEEEIENDTTSEESTSEDENTDDTTDTTSDDTDDTNDDTTSDEGKDRIEAILTTSRDKYTNATNGQWILITESEYNALANEMLDVSKSGVLESEYNESSNIITTTSSPTTLTNETETAVMPANSYLFAFKYYAIQASDQPGLKVKQSSSGNLEGYADVGEPLPRHTASNQEVFFVLKGNDLPSISGHLAIFKPAGLTIGRKSTTDNNTYYFELGDTSSVSDKTSTPLKLLYQGLSTTTIQWE